jgi:hypothetical protein
MIAMNAMYRVTGSTGLRLINSKTGGRYSPRKIANNIKELVALGAFIERMAGEGWEFIDAVQNSSGHGIDAIFRNVSANTKAKLAWGESKGGAQVLSVVERAKVYSGRGAPEGRTPGKYLMNQASWMWFFTRLMRRIEDLDEAGDAVRVETYQSYMRELANGAVEFFGYFAGNEQLYQFDSKPFGLTKTTNLRVQKTM